MEKPNLKSQTRISLLKAEFFKKIGTTTKKTKSIRDRDAAEFQNRGGEGGRKKNSERSRTPSEFGAHAVPTSEAEGRASLENAQC